MSDFLKNNLSAVCALATVIAFLYAAREFLILGNEMFAAVALVVAVAVGLITAYRFRQISK